MDQIGYAIQQVERDDCINFTEMSDDETHIVTLLSVALHYGIILKHEASRYPERKLGASLYLSSKLFREIVCVRACFRMTYILKCSLRIYKCELQLLCALFNLEDKFICFNTSKSVLCKMITYFQHIDIIIYNEAQLIQSIIFSTSRFKKHTFD